jgi:hypothetical protein
MELDKGRQLFFGCKIDSKLREALAQAKPGDRHYFEDPDAQFLQICGFGEERWIGKVVKCGLGVPEVEDIQRNVLSILRRIAPDVRKASSTVKIFPLLEGTEVSDEPEEEPEPSAEGSEGGPYIDNY